MSIKAVKLAALFAGTVLAACGGNEDKDKIPKSQRAFAVACKNIDGTIHFGVSREGFKDHKSFIEVEFADTTRIQTAAQNCFAIDRAYPEKYYQMK